MIINLALMTVFVVFCLWVLYWAYKDEWLGTLITLATILALVVSCNQSDWWQRSEKVRDAERHAEYVRDTTPHVVREADGCKVYAFKAGDRWHYFTRCQGGSTTTESSYEEKCGKNCKKTIVETIPMEGVKKDGK